MSCWEVIMDKSKIIRYVVIVVSFLTMAATAIPCQQIITESEKKRTVEYNAVMPSFLGVIIVIMAIGCVVLAFSSKYRHCIWTALCCALAIGGKLVIFMTKVGVVHHEANFLGEAYEEIGAMNLDTTYDITTKTYYGFYIIAGCAVVLLITGLITFFVGFIKKPEIEDD